VQIGRFVVQSEIARGGQGAIFDAWDPSSQRRVAIKLLRTGRSAVTAERLLREGQALTQLKHPGLVPCLEVGEAQGAIYLVLGFVEGSSLGEALRTEGALPLPRALRVADDLAGIVDYVHSRGLIHRDLKPDNVLLSPSGQVVLADFGLAKDLGASQQESLTRTGAAMGSPGYWAPEQVRGEKQKVGPPTDVYGWAATVYALFCGDAPRTATTLQELLDGLDVPPPALRVRRAEVPAWLDALLSRCLASDPSERPTLAEVRRALAKGLRGVGHEGRASSRGTLAVLGGAAVALLAGGLGWAVFGGETAPSETAPSETTPSETTPSETTPSETTPTESNPWVVQVQQQLVAEDYATARATADVGLEAQPDPKLYLLRATALDELGQPEAALADYTRCLELVGETAALQTARGTSLLELERYAEAAEALARAVELDPDDFDALALLVTAFVEAGEPLTALGLINANRDPRAPGIVAWVVGRVSIQNGEPVKALSAFDRAVALSGEATARVDRGRTKLLLDDPQGALRDFRAALEATQEGDARAWLGLARACQRLGRGDEQREAARAYLRLRPWGGERAAAEALAR